MRKEFSEINDAEALHDNRDVIYVRLWSGRMKDDGQVLRYVL